MGPYGSQAGGVCEKDRPLEDPRLLDQVCAGHLAVAVERKETTVDDGVESRIGVGNNDRHSGVDRGVDTRLAFSFLCQFA